MGMISLRKINFSEIHYDKDDEFLKYFVKTLPKEIKKKSFFKKII